MNDRVTAKFAPATLANIYAVHGWSLDVREPMGMLGYHLTANEKPGDPTGKLYVMGFRSKVKQTTADSVCPMTGVRLYWKKAGTLVQVTAVGYAANNEDLKKWCELVNIKKA